MIAPRPATAPPSRTLGQKVATGAGWMVAFRWVDRVIGLASIAVLARLIVPADFGIVGYAMVVIGLLEIFTETSTDAALIREKAAGRDDYDAAWTLNMIRGFALGGLTVALAPAAAAYFGEPRLLPIMAALACAPVVLGFENVGIVDFRKGLAFDREFRFLLSTRVIATIATVALAFTLRNYWALVLGTLARAVLRTALSFAAHPFRPRPSLARMGALFRFSRWMILQNILAGLNQKLPAFVVGKVFGSSPLAFFNIAREVADLSTTELAAPIRRALYPGLAHVAGQRDALAGMLVASAGMLALVTLPVPLGIALVASDLVPLFLGAAWADAASLLRPLCIAAAVAALGTNSQLAYIASSRSHLAATASAVRLALLAPLLFFAARQVELEGIGYVLAGVSGVLLAADYVFARAMLGLSLRRLLAAIHRPILGALALCAAVVVVRQSLPAAVDAAGHAVSLAASVATGAFTYAAVVLGLWSVEGRPDGAERRLLALVQYMLAAAPFRRNLRP